MTTATPSDSNPLYVGDLPASVLVAALFAVGDSWSTARHFRRTDPLMLHEAEEAAREAGARDELGRLGLDYYAGRCMKFAIVDGYLDPEAFDANNANGKPLAKAIIDRLRSIGSDQLLAIFAESGGQTQISEIARDVLEDLDVGRAARIELLDRPETDGLTLLGIVPVVGHHDPSLLESNDAMMSILRDVTVTRYFLRAVWLEADEQMTFGVTTDPLAALRIASDRLALHCQEGERPFVETCLGHAQKFISGVLSGREGADRQAAWGTVPRLFDQIILAQVPNFIASVRESPSTAFGK